MQKLTHYINGKLVEGNSGRFGDVFDPATGKVQKQVPMGTIAELDAAVSAAKAAFPEWAAMPSLRRARCTRLAGISEVVDKATDCSTTL